MPQTALTISLPYFVVAVLIPPALDQVLYSTIIADDFLGDAVLEARQSCAHTLHKN